MAQAFEEASDQLGGALDRLTANMDALKQIKIEFQILKNKYAQKLEEIKEKNRAIDSKNTHIKDLENQIIKLKETHFNETNQKDKEIARLNQLLEVNTTKLDQHRRM